MIFHLLKNRYSLITFVINYRDTFPYWDGWDGDYDDIKIRGYRSHSRNDDSYNYYEPDFWLAVDCHELRASIRVIAT